MPDIDSRLADYARGWQAAADSGAAPDLNVREVPPMPHRRRALLPAIAAAVVVAAIAAGLALWPSTHSTTPQRQVPSVTRTPRVTVPLTTRVFPVLRLSYPASWTYYPFTTTTAAGFGPTGWLTNATSIEPVCRSTGHEISCGTPATRLGPGQVSIEFRTPDHIGGHTARSRPSDSPSTRITVGGLPASVIESDGPIYGLPGSTRTLTYDLSTSHGLGEITISAVFGPDSAQTEAEFRTMLATATYAG